MHSERPSRPQSKQEKPTSRDLKALMQGEYVDAEGVTHSFKDLIADIDAAHAEAEHTYKELQHDTFFKNICATDREAVRHCFMEMQRLERLKSETELLHKGKVPKNISRDELVDMLKHMQNAAQYEPLITETGKENIFDSVDFGTLDPLTLWEPRMHSLREAQETFASLSNAYTTLKKERTSQNDQGDALWQARGKVKQAFVWYYGALCQERPGDKTDQEYFNEATDLFEFLVEEPINLLEPLARVKEQSPKKVKKKKKLSSSKSFVGTPLGVALLIVAAGAAGYVAGRNQDHSLDAYASARPAGEQPGVPAEDARIPEEDQVVTSSDAGDPATWEPLAPEFPKESELHPGHEPADAPPSVVDILKEER